MPSTVEALTILLVLLPGFLCARIVQALCVRPEQSELDKVIEALIYSFLVYVLYVSTVGSLDLSAKHLVLLTIYSIVLAVFVAADLTNDWHGKLLRRKGITHRTSNTAVWNDVFYNLGGYLLVELRDGRLVAGWVRYFSDRDDAASLFLEDATWINRDSGTEIPIDGPGILLTKEAGICTIAFLRGTTSESGQKNSQMADA